MHELVSLLNCSHKSVDVGANIANRSKGHRQESFRSLAKFSDVEFNIATVIDASFYCSTLQLASFLTSSNASLVFFEFLSTLSLFFVGQTVV